MSDKFLRPDEPQYLLLSTLLGEGNPIVAAALVESVEGITAYGAIVKAGETTQVVVFVNSMSKVGEVTDALTQVFINSRYADCLPSTRFDFRMLKAAKSSPSFDLETYITTDLTAESLTEVVAFLGHAKGKKFQIRFSDEDELLVYQSLEAQGLIVNGVFMVQKNDLTIPKLVGIFCLKNIEGVKAFGKRETTDTIYFALKDGEIMVMLVSDESNHSRSPYAVFPFEKGLNYSAAGNLSLRLKNFLKSGDGAIEWTDVRNLALQNIGWKMSVT